MNVTAISAIFFGFQMGGSWFAFLGGYLLVMLSMFSIGMMVGGISPNTKIAGAVASLLYFTMLWLFASLFHLNFSNENNEAG